MIRLIAIHSLDRGKALTVEAMTRLTEAMRLRRAEHAVPPTPRSELDNSSYLSDPAQ